MNKTYREQKLTAMLPKIRNDLTKMVDLLTPGLVAGGNAATSQAYLKQQIQKYLKPLDVGGQFVVFRANVDSLILALQSPPMLNVAKDTRPLQHERPNWDTEGDAADHMPWTLSLGGGWAYRNKIRICEKAFVLFPELTLRGVMVHEATHFALGTQDIFYNTFTRHSVMQDLPNGASNADNWRIFYQKMSEQFTKNL
jgi:hypothetical protein